MKRILLLSTSTLHGSSFLQYAADFIKQFLNEAGVSRVLFVPYASKDCDAYASKVKQTFQQFGYDCDSIHDAQDKPSTIASAQAIFIGGGNTFLLLKTLYDLQLIEPIKRRIIQDGVPYMGASAGTNVATISICTTNDMPIVHPPSLEALGFLPFNINPHYLDPDTNSKHMGETRETRIAEYHSIEGTPPVVGLREGCLLHLHGHQLLLKGLAGLSARLFISKQQPTELPVGSDLSFLLKP